MQDRRFKYANKSIVKNDNIVVDINFDITELDLFCNYITSSNTSIRRANVVNLRNVFLIMDKNNYAGDNERLSRIDFVMKGIEARLIHNLSSSTLILSHINGGLGTNIPVNVMHELSNHEIDWINEMISAILKDSIIYNDVDELLELLTRFKATPYNERGPIRLDIEKAVARLNNKFRKARTEKAEDLMFSLRGETFNNAVLDTYRQLASPSNKLKFGVQALNALTGGGIAAGRVYCLLGLPGEGKSSTLLDMALQIKKYNKDYQCKDKTKKPCVVLLVMENGTKESIERIVNMVTGKNMLDFTEDEIVNILRTKGQLNLTDDDPIDIIIKFRPNLSEDTSYLYTLTEDLEDDGYEVIAFLQDYLKRIRSVEGTFNNDLRMQLGAIINEFKVFSILKDIPVVTASQLNRTATSSIDEARVKNKADLVRLLGRSNVGESNLILENSDHIMLIAPEYDRDGNKILGAQAVKSRYYIPGDFHIAFMPYIKNSIKLVEDYYSAVPVHKITMRDEPLMNGPVQQHAGNLINITEFKDVKLLNDNSNNMFANATGFAAKRFNKKIDLCRIVEDKSPRLYA